MKFKGKQKKQIKKTLIKLGNIKPEQRDLFWEYILKGDLGVGYAQAQDLQRRLEFEVLKPLRDWGDQPD